MVTSSRENMDLVCFFWVGTHDNVLLHRVTVTPRASQANKQVRRSAPRWHPCHGKAMRHLKAILLQERECLAGRRVPTRLKPQMPFIHRAHSGHESHDRINKETRPPFFPSPVKTPNWWQAIGKYYGCCYYIKHKMDFAIFPK